MLVTGEEFSFIYKILTEYILMLHVYCFFRQLPKADLNRPLWGANLSVRESPHKNIGMTNVKYLLFLKMDGWR